MKGMGGENINSPIQYRRHDTLKRVSDESPYRSYCPVCDQGVLLVRVLWVDPETGEGFQLATYGCERRPSRYDRCTLCGQQFCYLGEKIGEEPFWEELSPDGEVFEALDQALKALPRTRYDVLSED